MSTWSLPSQGKLLTGAMSADPVKAGDAYDVPAISQGWDDLKLNTCPVFDLLNIMDYDYHGGWENFTGGSGGGVNTMS